MKVEIKKNYTKIILENEEMYSCCKPGYGSETCIWLMASIDGLECTKFNKHPVLVEKFEKGLTVAKRDGCKEMEEFSEIISKKSSSLKDDEKYIFEYNLLGEKNL